MASSPCHVEGNETKHRFNRAPHPTPGHNVICTCGAVVVRRVGGLLEISTRTARVLQDVMP